MKKCIGIALWMAFCSQVAAQERLSDLEARFLNPPASVKPYVWWHWMGPNFSKIGITKDLEAMKAMGIGGATIFNLASAVQETHAPTLNNPWPAQTYRSPAYWEAIKHAAAEAKRLGLEIGLHNTAGYSTTGGPWVTEERAMQKLVWSKRTEEGGKPLLLNLSKPELPIFQGWGSPKNRATFYKDVVVLAVPVGTNIGVNQVIDLSSKMDADGLLRWDAPAGQWLIYRIGHAPTMANPHPLPDDIIGKSLEVDKMSAEQNRFHWQTVINPLKEKVGEYLGDSFKHLLIDSYEADFQNWTPAFRAEFFKRKGYDPVPWILCFDTNADKKPFVLENEEQTQRFRWDFKDVVNQLFFDNGWGVGKKLMKEAKLTLQFEPYEGPFDIAEGSALADLPMGEFWTHRGGIDARISAAARAAGRTVVGAEAFTGRPEVSQYTEDPAFLKPTANEGFAAGVNRLILHHWVHQPFDDKYQPGMGMGWWGTHFGRHQTWAEPGKAFIAYLSRSQALLQYGEEVGDYLCLESLHGFGDLISKRDFIKQKITVVQGKIKLESGRVYPFLVLPNTPEMPVEVAEKIKSLVAGGATVVGPKPLRSAGLKDYPECDAQVAKIGNEVWTQGNTYGKGNICTTLEEAKRLHGIKPDHVIEKADSAQAVKVIHRTGREGDVYFVTNLSTYAQHITVSFRVSGKQPEIWQAEKGTISNAPVWQEKNGRTSVQIQLGDYQSAFIVFRKPVSNADHLTFINAENRAEDWTILPLNEGQNILFSKTPLKASLGYASGKTRVVKVDGASKKDIDGLWKVQMNPKSDAPFTVELADLVDFSQHNDPRVKYFAGTATYLKTIQLEANAVRPDKRIILNLGVLNDIVSLKVNGKDLGVLWYPPYQTDITQAVKAGANTLEIAVTNNWANRLIGDEQEPVDFEWGTDRGEDKGRAMKAYPDWFIKNQTRPSQGRKTFLIWYYYRKDSPLKPAGLVGPVRLEMMDTKAI
jgi:hypothetical protein